MNNWRIVRREHYGTTSWSIQKRFLGFLWWCNPDPSLYNISHSYASLERAKEGLKSATFKTKKYVEDIK